MWSVFICVYLTWIWRKSMLIKLRGELRQLPRKKKTTTTYKLLFSEIFRFKPNIPQWKKIGLNGLAWYQRNCTIIYIHIMSWLNSETILTSSLTDRMLIEAVQNDKMDFSLSPKQSGWKSLLACHISVSVQRWARIRKVWSHFYNGFVIKKYLDDR